MKEYICTWMNERIYWQISLTFAKFDYEIAFFWRSFYPQMCIYLRKPIYIALNSYYFFCAIARFIIHLARERIFSALFPHYAGLFTDEHTYFFTDVPGSYMIRPE